MSSKKRAKGVTKDKKFIKAIKKELGNLIPDVFLDYKNQLFNLFEIRYMSITEGLAELEEEINKLKHHRKKAGLKIFKMDENLNDLIYKKKGDSGLDIQTTVTKKLAPGESFLFPTGIKMWLRSGYEIQVRPKSSRSLDDIEASLGTVDSNYRGEIKVLIRNLSHETKTFEKYDTIAQLVITQVAEGIIRYVESEEELPPSERGSGGFGSTANVTTITVKELNVDKDDLLHANAIVDDFNYYLPYNLENGIIVTQLYTNLSKVKAKIEYDSERIEKIENDMVFLKGNEKGSKLDLILIEGKPEFTII